MVRRRRYGRFHVSRPSHLRHPKSYKVLCSVCGKEVVTPVPPPNGKKLFCMECFSDRNV